MIIRQICLWPDLWAARPEDFSVADNQSVNTIDVRVSVIEHIGSALIVHGYCNKTQITASLAPHCNVERDTTIALAVNVEALHIFDAKTERMLI